MGQNAKNFKKHLLYGLCALRHESKKTLYGNAL